MQAVLDGRVAIVTGAGGGLGSAYARALAEAGAEVVLADVDEGAAKTAAAALEADGYAALAVHTDVTSEESTRAMADAALGRFGGIDILVNNAALMAEIPSARVTELPIEFWDRVLRVNLTGPLLCVRAVVDAMKERGQGKIINQSSGGAFGPAGAYGVSKLGLVSLTVTLARELAPYKINVNALAPGWVDTDAGRRASPAEMREMIAHTVPLKGIGDTDDVVGALLFLASSASDWVTGQTLNVDGGWVMRI